VATPPHDITEWLANWSQGDRLAIKKLAPLVYHELHRLAQIYMRGERPGHTLQTTALVNEAYVRLMDTGSIQWKNRAHFYAVAAKLMRHILIDFARARGNLKRGGGVLQVSLEEALTISQERGAELIALDHALSTLAKLNFRQSQVVELRFFGGLTETEIAEVLKISPRSVSADWSMARAWLLRELSAKKRHDA
jgi:RNA polymerase sigma factor (TIGR02999 family)